MRERALGVATVAAAAVALVFLLLPIVAIFAHTSPGHLIDQLSSPVVRDALVVSLKTSVIAQMLIIVFGTPAAPTLGPPPCTCANTAWQCCIISPADW